MKQKDEARLAGTLDAQSDKTLAGIITNFLGKLLLTDANWSADYNLRLISRRLASKVRNRRN